MTRAHEAVVFDVQRFSLHDGPGLRTVVFFKGCGLACEWCQNPEALRRAPELSYAAERCLEGCRDCLATCDAGALRDDRARRLDFLRCTACGACIEVCPSAALRWVGEPRTPGELLEAVLRDRPFYDVSGGGVTLSGGEPVLHAAFLRELLPLAKEQGLHVAIETSGQYPWPLLEGILPWIDLVLFDVKVMDPAAHRRLTGHDNAGIHDNLRRVLAAGARVEVRMPVVPGRNTSPENVAATARFLAELGVPGLTLLPYNAWWEAKLPRIGTERRPLGIATPAEDFYTGLRQEFERAGIETRM